MAKEKKEKREKTYLEELAELTENPYAAVAEEGTSGDISGYISTGSYLLNGLLGGSIFTGLAGNKITAFAGEASTGKTFLVLDILKHFLKDNLEGLVIFFESESAVSKQMLIERDIDPRRLLILPIDTVQNYRTQILKILDKYIATPVSQRKPLLFVLDSLGMLSTSKELEDTASGKETSDMTRAKLIKSTFRVITLKMGLAKVPNLVTNHTYDEQGLFAKKVMCMTGDNEILDRNNNPIQISMIEVGDLVMTCDGPKEVMNTFHYDDAKIIEVIFDDGCVIKCTKDHKFLTNNEYVSVENLRVGDNITTI